MHLHEVRDQDTHYVIDPITMAITNPNEAKNKLMLGDMNSEIYTFEIPRFVEGHDMTLCNVVEIHFINIDLNKTGTSAGVYKVRDMAAAEDDPDTLVFSWLVSGKATKYPGTLNYRIKFACTDGEIYTYIKWSDLYKGITVGEGIDNSAAVAEEYTDILAYWDEMIRKIAPGKVYIGAEEPEDWEVGIWIKTEGEATEDELSGEIYVRCEDGVFFPLQVRTVGSTEIDVGVGNEIGYTGYYFTALGTNDANYPTITLSMKKGVEDTEGMELKWVAGDTLSMKCDSWYANFGKIIAVSGNVLTVDSVPVSALGANADFDNNTVIVTEKPTDGQVELGLYASAFGYNNGVHTKGGCAIGGGNKIYPSGGNGFAHGYRNVVRGSNATAINYQNTANGDNTFAGGMASTAEGSTSFAFGYGAKASGKYSAAFNRNTVASGENSFAVGSNNTTASGTSSFACGMNNQATGQGSSVGGYACQANAEYSHADGYASIASGERQFVVGQYNKNDADDADSYFVVGNGASGNRKTAFRIRKSGEIDACDNRVRNIKQGTESDDAAAMWQLWAVEDKITGITPESIGAATKSHQHSQYASHNWVTEQIEAALSSGGTDSGGTDSGGTSSGGVSSAELEAHLDATNPHGITPAMIGAASLEDLEDVVGFDVTSVMQDRGSIAGDSAYLCKKNGVYYIVDAEDVPEDAWGGQLLVLRGGVDEGGESVAQLAFSTDNKMYFRSGNSNSYSFDEVATVDYVNANAGSGGLGVEEVTSDGDNATSLGVMVGNPSKLAKFYIVTVAWTSQEDTSRTREFDTVIVDAALINSSSNTKYIHYGKINERSYTLECERASGDAGVSAWFRIGDEYNNMGIVNVTAYY